MKLHRTNAQTQADWIDMDLARCLRRAGSAVELIPPERRMQWQLIIAGLHEARMRVRSEMHPYDRAATS